MPLGCPFWLVASHAWASAYLDSSPRELLGLIRPNRARRDSQGVGINPHTGTMDSILSLALEKTTDIGLNEVFATS